MDFMPEKLMKWQHVVDWLVLANVVKSRSGTRGIKSRLSWHVCSLRPTQMKSYVKLNFSIVIPGNWSVKCVCGTCSCARSETPAWEPRGAVLQGRLPDWWNSGRPSWCHLRSLIWPASSSRQRCTVSRSVLLNCHTVTVGGFRRTQHVWLNKALKRGLRRPLNVSEQHNIFCLMADFLMACCRV